MSIAAKAAVTVPNRRINDLHPKFQLRVVRLAKAMTDLHEAGKTKLHFELYEGYRSPERQRYLLEKGTTKAGPWQSAHQFGLAVDFVPKTQHGWTWEAPDEDWRVLKRTAEQLGLANPIEWDKPHIEHKQWPTLRNFVGSWL